MKKNDCPDKDQHTPCPDGYMAWFDWADRMAETHKQIKCKGCGLYTIWVLKEKK